MQAVTSGQYHAHPALPPRVRVAFEMSGQSVQFASQMSGLDQSLCLVVDCVQTAFCAISFRGYLKITVLARIVSCWQQSIWMLLLLFLLIPCALLL